MNECRQLLGVEVANGLLYAVSGVKSKTVECYDFATNKWTIICSLGKELGDPHKCTIFRDKVVICYCDCVDEYDPTAEKWKVNESLKGLANIYCAFSYSDKLLVTKFA